MYRRGTLLCADPAIGLIRAHTLHRQQSSPEIPNPALEYLPGILCYFFTLYWDILPNWLGFPNMNLRESPGHTSMDLIGLVRQPRADRRPHSKWETQLLDQRLPDFNCSRLLLV